MKLITFAVLVSQLMVPTFTTPMELGDWLRDNFTYQNDLKEYWKTPEETIRDKGGDCEDFAFLVSDILTLMNIDNQVFAMQDIQKRGHAICIFTYNKRFGYFSNQAVKFVNYPDAVTLIKEEYDDIIYIWTIKPDKSNILINR